VDAVLNGKHSRGQEIVIEQELGRYLVFKVQGKEFMRCDGTLFIQECLRVFGTRHQWARDALKERGG
jgi:hypothetical protein